MAITYNSVDFRGVAAEPIIDGSFKIEFEGEALAQDAEVWMTDENGEKQPIPDGEYNLENDMRSK